MRIKMAVLATATALLSGVALAAGTGTASAATESVHAQVVQAADGNYTYLVLKTSSGAVVGEGEWSQNPQDGNPGDALRAYDGRADGYGIHAYLSDGRMASTAGHPKGYWSGWVTGNLPETHKYTMQVCQEKGGTDYVCASGTVTS